MGDGSCVLLFSSAVMLCRQAAEQCLEGVVFRLQVLLIACSGGIVLFSVYFIKYPVVDYACGFNLYNNVTTF